MAEKRFAVKALHGRGTKRQDWVEYLHQILLHEFEWISSSYVQLSRSLIKSVALTLLVEDGAPYTSSNADSTTGRLIAEYATMKWDDSFLNRFNVVTRRQSGALSRSTSQTSFIERKFSFDVVSLQRRFDSNLLDENVFDDVDETQFAFSLDNH